jgi:hypothetical protein
MTTPGFTAEAALYKTSERYKLVADQADRPSGQAVIPQYWRCFLFGSCNLLCCWYDDYTGRIIYCEQYRVC